MTDRRFTFWYYTVSHSMALLRSAGRNGDENIDIVFWAVSYIEIPMDMDGIELGEPTDADREYISRKAGEVRGEITVLVQGERKYYIVSAGMKVVRNHLDAFELPFDIPSDMGGNYYRPKD